MVWQGITGTTITYTFFNMSTYRRCMKKGIYLRYAWWYRHGHRCPTYSAMCFSLTEAMWLGILLPGMVWFGLRCVTKSVPGHHFSFIAQVWPIFALVLAAHLLAQGQTCYICTPVSRMEPSTFSNKIFNFHSHLSSKVFKYHSQLSSKVFSIQISIPTIK
jgi:hypothetical protein